MKSWLSSLVERRYKSKTTIYLALDIGSSTIRALVFKMTPDEKIRILGTGASTRKSTGQTFDIYDTVKSSETAIKKAEEKAQVISDRVILALPNEYISSVNITGESVRTRAGQPITQNELESFFEGLEKDAYNRVGVGKKIIHSQVTGIKLDGRRVSNAVGHAAKTISAELLNIFADETVLTFYETVAEELGLDLLTIAAESQAVASGITGVEESQFLLVDISQEATRASLIKHGQLVSTGFFSIGGRFFTRVLAHGLNETEVGAAVIKHQYADDTLSSRGTAKVGELLREPTEQWKRGLELLFKELNQKSRTGKVIVFGGSRRLPEIFTHLVGAKPIKASDFDITNTTGHPIDEEFIICVALASFTRALFSSGSESEMSRQLKKAIRTVGK